MKKLRIVEYMMAAAAFGFLAVIVGGGFGLVDVEAKRSASAKWQQDMYEVELPSGFGSVAVEEPGLDLAAYSEPIDIDGCTSVGGDGDGYVC